MLLRKLESLEKYAIAESIFDSLASPEHVNTLLKVMNSTLPVIWANVSSEDEEDGFDSSVYIPDCSHFLCRDCSMCIANCAVHRLKRGIMDLIQLLEYDHVPECEVCVEESLQTEAVQLADKLEEITDELLNQTACVSFILMHFVADTLLYIIHHAYVSQHLYFPQLHHCDQLLELQGRLEMISTWMNDSLTSLNGSHSFQNLELLVERLSVGVLPEIRKSLVSIIIISKISVLHSALCPFHFQCLIFRNSWSKITVQI